MHPSFPLTMSFWHLYSTTGCCFEKLFFFFDDYHAKKCAQMRTFDSDNAMWLVMDIYGIHEKRLPRMQKYKKIPYSHFSVNCRCGEDRGKNMRQKKFHIVCPPAKKKDEEE